MGASVFQTAAKSLVLNETSQRSAVAVEEAESRRIAAARERKEQRRQRLFEEDTLEFLAAKRHELADQLDYRRDHLKTCLAKVPDKSRSILVGYYFREQTVEEISDQTGRTAEAIYKALQRIRKRLMTCIETKIQADGTSA